MKNKKSDDWVRGLSTIAVLLGVALVILELRQNSDLIELQILKQSSDNFAENSLSLLPENLYEIRQKSMDNPQDLTHLEYRVLDSYYWSITVLQWRSLYDLAERGLLEQSAWHRMVEDEARVFLAYPFGRAWWKGTKEVTTTLPKELVAAVDDVLSDAPNNFSARSFEDAIRRLKEEQ